MAPHYNDVIMGAIASQITSLTVVYSVVYSDVDQRKHQSSVSLAFVRGIHRGPLNSPHKWPVMRKMFPFDDLIMKLYDLCSVFVTALLYRTLCYNRDHSGYGFGHWDKALHSNTLSHWLNSYPCWRAMVYPIRYTWFMCLLFCCGHILYILLIVWVIHIYRL